MNHQPGPVTAYEVPCDRLGRYEIHGPSDGKLCEVMAVHIRREGNAKLFAAAYTSYDKHFGAEAIHASECDWIGSAIETMRLALEDGCDTPSHIVYEINKLLERVKI